MIVMLKRQEGGDRGDAGVLGGVPWSQLQASHSAEVDRGPSQGSEGSRMCSSS